MSYKERPLYTWRAPKVTNEFYTGKGMEMLSPLGNPTEKLAPAMGWMRVGIRITIPDTTNPSSLGLVNHKIYFEKNPMP